MALAVPLRGSRFLVRRGSAAFFVDYGHSPDLPRLWETSGLRHAAGALPGMFDEGRV